MTIAFTISNIWGRVWNRWMCSGSQSDVVVGGGVVTSSDERWSKQPSTPSRSRQTRGEREESGPGDGTLDLLCVRLCGSCSSALLVAAFSRTIIPERNKGDQHQHDNTCVCANARLEHLDPSLALIVHHLVELRDDLKTWSGFLSSSRREKRWCNSGTGSQGNMSINKDYHQH